MPRAGLCDFRNCFCSDSAAAFIKKMGDGENVPCFLVLEDGTVFPGESFGAKRQIDGEVGKWQHVVIMFLGRIVTFRDECETMYSLNL